MRSTSLQIKTFVNRYRNIWPQILIVLYGLLLVSPQYWIPQPLLIDDASDYIIARMSYVDLLNSELFGGQRTWPIRLIYRKMLFDGFGLSMGWHYFANGALLAGTFVLVYLVFRQWIDKRWIALASVLLMMSTPPVIASYYRLGTGEPLQLLCYVLFLWLLGKKKIQYLIVALVSLFVKETSLFLTGVFALLLFMQKKVMQSVLLLVPSIIFAAVILTKIFRYHDYVGNATFGLRDIGSNVLFSMHYFPLPFVLLWVSFLTIVLWHWYAGNHISKIEYIWGIALATLAPVALWKYNKEYYFLPSYVFSGMVAVVVGFVAGKKSWVYALPLVFFGVSLFFEVPLSLVMARSMHREAVGESALVGYLLAHDFDGKHVYGYVRHFERNHKIFLYASKFSTRSLLFVPDMQRWTASAWDPDRLSVYLEEARQLYEADTEKKILIASVTDASRVCKESMQTVCGYSSWVGKQCSYAVCTTQ